MMWKVNGIMYGGNDEGLFMVEWKERMVQCLNIFKILKYMEATLTCPSKNFT